MRFPRWQPLLAVPLVAVVVLLGVWLTGGVLTDDAGLATTLTGAWFAVAGALAVLVAWRARGLAVAVVGTWLVTSVAAGGFLLVTSSVDRVVDEHVVMAVGPSVAPTAGSRAAAAPTLLASGAFRSAAHDTSGVASLVRTPTGRRVLTLTDFATSPGPDLRVYLVPRAAGVSDSVDLGRLKGNKGDQQYDVPRTPGTARAGRVVIWCRAFSVEFGSAALGRP